MESGKATKTGTATTAGAWRSRAFVSLGVGAVVALSWAYLVRMNAGMAALMPGMADGRMTMPSRPIPYDLAATFLMWSVMMVAMMVPSTIQALSVVMSLSARRHPGGPASWTTFFFVGGYVTAWAGFSLLIAASQVSLSRAAFLTPMMQSASVVLSIPILLAAGVFQFTPAKEACLVKCRTPLAFFLAEWRDGLGGAFRMGLGHGRYCVACCWAVMAVMFVVGAMNLLWMAALALFVLIEKLAPARLQVSRMAGGLLILWGAAIAFDTFA